MHWSKCGCCLLLCLPLYFCSHLLLFLCCPWPRMQTGGVTLVGDLWGPFIATSHFAPRRRSALIAPQSSFQATEVSMLLDCCIASSSIMPCTHLTMFLVLLFNANLIKICCRIATRVFFCPYEKPNNLNNPNYQNDCLWSEWSRCIASLLHFICFFYGMYSPSNLSCINFGSV